MHKTILAGLAEAQKFRWRITIFLQSGHSLSGTITTEPPLADPNTDVVQLNRSDRNAWIRLDAIQAVEVRTTELSTRGEGGRT